MIACHIKATEDAIAEGEEEKILIEEMEAALGAIFETELANVEIFLETYEKTGPIDVNDTDVWFFIDVASTNEAVARVYGMHARKLLRERILSMQETHTLKFTFRTWVRLLEGSFDQP